MHDSLFWLSLFLATGGLVLVRVMKVMRSDPATESPPVSHLPTDRQ